MIINITSCKLKQSKHQDINPILKNQKTVMESPK